MIYLFKNYIQKHFDHPKNYHYFSVVLGSLSTANSLEMNGIRTYVIKNVKNVAEYLGWSYILFSSPTLYNFHKNLSLRGLCEPYLSQLYFIFTLLIFTLKKPNLKDKLVGGIRAPLVFQWILCKKVGG